MTLIELSEFVKAFEETFDVTAAAPVAVAAAPAAGGAGAEPLRRRRRTSSTSFSGRRRQEDRRHQGGACAHQPGSEGGQGPGRGCPKPVLEKVNKETADKAKEALEGAGATVTLK